MTKEQISAIQSYIKDCPEMNNSQLARHIRNTSNELGYLSVGSLRNYIGKVRKMEIKDDIVDTFDEPNFTLTISRVDNGNIVREAPDALQALLITNQGLNFQLASHMVDALYMGEKITLNFSEKEEATALEEEVFGFGFEVTIVANEIQDTTLTEIGGVSFNPHSEPQEINNKFSEDPVLPMHMDYLVVSVNEEIVSGDNLKNYIDECNSSCINKIVVYGNEPRIASITEDGVLNTVKGGIGNGVDKVGTHGLKEEYRLIDAIDMVIADALRNCKDPGDTPVNITIVTERGVDFGSRNNSLEGVSEMIHKLKSRFGWCVSMITRDANPQKLALDYGIDSSNITTYNYTQDLMDTLVNARAAANFDLQDCEPVAVGYFSK